MLLTINLCGMPWGAASTGLAVAQIYSITMHLPVILICHDLARSLIYVESVDDCCILGNKDKLEYTLLERQAVFHVKANWMNLGCLKIRITCPVYALGVTEHEYKGK